MQVEDYALNAAQMAETSRFSEDGAIIIDLRSRGYFLTSHIKDAINITEIERIKYIAQENPKQKIVLYCYHGNTAREMMILLRSFGYQNIFFYDGDYFKLQGAGCNIETGKKAN